MTTISMAPSSAHATIGSGENVAASRTMAQSSRGVASVACQCRRCLRPENPAVSRSLMKPGRDQNDMVSGEAKLSWICAKVSDVRNL